MDYVFKPKSPREAFSWYAQLPFYSLQNAVKGSEVSFKRDQVLSLERVAGGWRAPPRYRLGYSRPDFDGSLFCVECPDSLWREKGKPEAPPVRVLFPKIEWEYLTKFYKYSASTVTGLGLVLFAALFALARNWLIYDSAVPARFVNPTCDLECVRRVFGLNFSFLLIVFCSFFPVVISAYYFLARSPKVRNARFYLGMRSEAVVIGLFGLLLIIILAIQMTGEDGRWAQLKRVNQAFFLSTQ